ncbi:MAG: MBL fold metallo-hydrolase [Bacilli bacterium]|nr:MBL fold metallo-hydrolase [Bacilli bacterium]
MLEQLGSKTYLINVTNKVGIFLINETDVAIIDTGFDDQAGQDILDICNNKKWHIKMILNTHSHIDHIGGNNIIQQKLNVPIYAKKMEKAIIENPEITAAIAFGGYPHKYLRNDYLLAKESKVLELTPKILPAGLEMLDLPGHNGNMVGFKTIDDIYFLADAIGGESILKKYTIQFKYNVEKYFETLDYIKTLKGKLFVPSHGENFSQSELDYIIKLNKDASEDIIKNIKKICQKKITFEQILKYIFEIYNLKMDFIQNTYIGASIKCYLSYLLDQSELEIIIEKNILYWRTL